MNTGLSNYERIGRALELLRQGLVPFVEREMRSVYGQRWVEEIQPKARGKNHVDVDAAGSLAWDVEALLRVIWENWHDVFRAGSLRDCRSLVSELRLVRIKHAHRKESEPFDDRHAYRVLDNVERLLEAIAAKQVPEAEALREGLALALSQRTIQTGGQSRELPPTAPKSGAVKGKYRPLHDHLMRVRDNDVTMTFGEVERVLGERLPPSAFKYQAW